MMRYAGVIVDLNAQQVDKAYTYLVPEGMPLTIGQRVLVPFGGRKLEGFVTQLADESAMESSRLKAIIRTLEDYPLILPELMDLAKWMQSAYRCTLAAALRQMIPAQLRGERVQIKRVNTAQLMIEGEALARERTVRAHAPRQLSLLSALAEGPKPLPLLAALVPGAHQALRTLAAQGIVSIDSEETRRSPHRKPPTRSGEDPALTDEQQAAVDRVTQALASGGGRFLLVGVTGSGKTEVYIRLIRSVLAAGQNAIVLVPEIALTPQMTDWFRARFGDWAAVLHSQLSAGERYDEWRRIRMGEARVVIGARSAVFAPMENVGLIVVDEEHEHTYQSEKHPCYDARDVARVRCEASGGALVLGSATPSIASYMKVMPGVRAENKLQLLELNERVFGRPMPEVDIVDMREELHKGNHSIFSAQLQDALTDCLDEGHQAMLLINRRGYSTFVSCRACGHVEKCEQCDVSMTYHQMDGLLKCHYCGAVRRPPTACPKCASPFIKFFGAGTQKVEEEVVRLWPHARVARMDMDTTRGKDAHEKILTAFRQREVDVLIGTQMIAKGLDFPSVTLVGVISADMSLNLPDYRSAERTFQLLTQVAGRAGRAELPGRVIVQTYEPTHYAVELAARQDFRAFYHEEAKLRRRGQYPPFTVLARLLVSSKDAAIAQQVAAEREVQLQAFLNENDLNDYVLRLRCVEAPIGKLRGEARWQVFIKVAVRSAGDILSEMERLSACPAEGARVELEINPTNML